jgi:hypothetical protein
MWNPFRKKSKACSYCGGKAPKAKGIYSVADRIFCSLDCLIQHNTLCDLEWKYLGVRRRYLDKEA